MVSAEEIKRWEEIIKDREDIAATLSNKLINFLYNFRDDTLSKLIKNDECPIKLSWKPSEKAIIINNIINEAIIKLSDI